MDAIHYRKILKIVLVLAVFGIAAEHLELSRDCDGKVCSQSK